MDNVVERGLSDGIEVHRSIPLTRSSKSVFALYTKQYLQQLCDQPAAQTSLPHHQKVAEHRLSDGTERCGTPHLTRSSISRNTQRLLQEPKV